MKIMIIIVVYKFPPQECIMDRWAACPGTENLKAFLDQLTEEEPDEKNNEKWT